MLKKVLLFLGGVAAGTGVTLGIGALVKGAKDKDKKSGKKYIEVPPKKEPEEKAPEPEKK